MNKKTVLRSSLFLALGAVADAKAGHVGEATSTYFTFTNGGTGDGGTVAPTGS